MIIFASFHSCLFSYQEWIQFVQKRYVTEDVERQWESHEREGKVNFSFVLRCVLAYLKELLQGHETMRFNDKRASECITCLNSVTCFACFCYCCCFESFCDAIRRPTELNASCGQVTES